MDNQREQYAKKCWDAVSDSTKESLRDDLLKPTLLARCTWGDGPDVMMSGHRFPTFNLSPPRWEHSVHGCVDNWQVALTSEQARKLANDLIIAASQAETNEKATEESQFMQDMMDGEHEGMTFAEKVEHNFAEIERVGKKPFTAVLRDCDVSFDLSVIEDKGSGGGS